MHQQTQNEDNMKPYKPSVLSLYTRDLLEAGNVYDNPIKNEPEQAVESVDEFIDAMLSYERFHPSVASEWLIEPDEMFYECGMYNCGMGQYVDIDDLLDRADKIMGSFNGYSI